MSQNHAKQERRLCLIPVTAILLLTAGLSLPYASAQGSSDRLGTVLWPTDQHQNSRDLAELGASLFEESTEPIKLGLTPVQTLDAVRENDTTTRLTAQERSSRNVSFVQHHDAWSGEQHDSLGVQPNQLLPMVGIQMAGARYSAVVLTVTGPPGTIPLNGTTIEEKVETLTEALAFPVDDLTVPVEPAGSFPGIYDGRTACFEEANDRCTTSVSFSIDCVSCTLAKFDSPQSDSGLDLPGVGFALFNDEERLIAATVQYVFDVDEATVLGPAIAREQAADGLHQRGYRVAETPGPDEVTVFGVLTPSRIDVRELHYRWWFVVSDEQGGEPGAGVDQTAEVIQHAATGKIISVTTSPADVPDEPTDRTVLDIVPIPWSTALFALLAVAFFHRRGRP